MKYLEVEWQSFRAMTVRLDATPVEIEERRRVFYAGALGMFSALYSTARDGHVPAQKDIDRLLDIMAELDEFTGEINEWARGAQS